MSDSRQKVLDKIRALLSKTVENGCTEEESLAALTKARAMMDSYEVTEEDVLEAQRDEAVSRHRDAHDPWSMRIYLCPAVARFTDCETYKSPTRRYHTRVHFVGLLPDVELAEWLLDHLVHFIQRELTRKSSETWGLITDRNERRQWTIGFVAGAIERIRARLDALTEASERSRTVTGNALVLVKNALILKLLPPGLTPSRGGNFKINRDGYEEGLDAGDRATFGRPVGTGGANRINRRKQVTQVAERLEWKHIYWVDGPTKGGTGMGSPARGEGLRLESRRPVYAVQDPTVSGWSHALVVRGEKRSTIFCPYAMASWQVPNDCAEFATAKDPRECRPDYLVGLITRNWTEAQRLGRQVDLVDTAAVVLKMLGAEIPHRIATADGDDTRPRGGKEAAEGLRKPVKRRGKRGEFLAWFMETGSRPVREAMAHFGMTRSNVLSYLFVIQKDHGIGYALQGDLATIILPDGVTGDKVWE